MKMSFVALILFNIVFFWAKQIACARAPQFRSKFKQNVQIMCNLSYKSRINASMISHKTFNQSMMGPLFLTLVLSVRRLIAFGWFDHRIRNYIWRSMLRLFFFPSLSLSWYGCCCSDFKFTSLACGWSMSFYVVHYIVGLQLVAMSFNLQKKIVFSVFILVHNKNKIINLTKENFRIQLKNVHY